MPCFLSFLLGLICDSSTCLLVAIAEYLLHRLSLNCKVDKDKMFTSERRWDGGMSLRDDK